MSYNIIFVGVGGTGCKIIKEVGDILSGYSRLYTGREVLPHNIGFIFIDTDMDVLDSIDFGTPVDLRTTPDQVKDFLGLPEDLLRSCASVKGVGMNRHCGMVLSVKGRGKLHDAVQATINELFSKTMSDDYVVIVVTSLGGGTGSGSFLYISNEIKKEFAGKPVNLIGICTLPKIRTGDHDIHRANAYGAIKEFSLLHHLARSGTFKIGGVEYTNPFDVILLVGTEVEELGEIQMDSNKAIAHFLIDLGYLKPAGVPQERKKIAQKFADWADMQTFAVLASSKLATLNYFQVTFPALSLKWIFDFEDYKSDFNINYQTLKNDIEDYQTKFDNIQGKTERIIRDINKLKIGLTEYETRMQKMPKKARAFYGKVKQKIKEIDDKSKKVMDDATAYKQQLNTYLHHLEQIRQKIDVFSMYMDRIMNTIVIPETKLGGQSIAFKTGNIEVLYPLTSTDIDLLRKIKDKITKMPLVEIIEYLDNENPGGAHKAKYSQAISTAINTFLVRPALINYRFAGATPLVSDEDITKVLREYNLITLKDSMGNFIDPLTKVDYCISMIASHNLNLDNLPQKVQIGISRWSSNMGTYSIRGGDLKYIRNPEIQPTYRLHSFAFYYVAFGLKMFPSLWDIETPFKDIDAFRNAYQKEASGKSIFAGVLPHHSFLLNHPIDAGKAIGLDVKEVAPKDAAEKLLNYLLNYVPSSMIDRVYLVSFICADVKKRAEQIKELVNAILRVSDGFKEDMAIEAMLDLLDRGIVESRKLDEFLDKAANRFDDYVLFIENIKKIEYDIIRSELPHDLKRGFIDLISDTLSEITYFRDDLASYEEIIDIKAITETIDKTLGKIRSDPELFRRHRGKLRRIEEELRTFERQLDEVRKAMSRTYEKLSHLYSSLNYSYDMLRG